jgi:hypothetical protein
MTKQVLHGKSLCKIKGGPGRRHTEFKQTTSAKNQVGADRYYGGVHLGKITRAQITTTA